MSNFLCEQCGTEIIDSEQGYVTGCVHYPADARSVAKSEALTAVRLLADRVDKSPSVELVSLSTEVDVVHGLTQGGMTSAPGDEIVTVCFRFRRDMRQTEAVLSDLFLGRDNPASWCSRDCQIYTGKCSCPDGDPICRPKQPEDK